MICEWFADPWIPWSVQGILLKHQCSCCVWRSHKYSWCRPALTLHLPHHRRQVHNGWDVPSGYSLHVTPAPATSPGSQNPEQAALCPTHLTVQKCTGKNFVLIVNLFNLTWSLIPELVSVLSRPNTDGCNGNINPKVKLSLQLSSSSSKILERWW